MSYKHDIDICSTCNKLVKNGHILPCARKTGTISRNGCPYLHIDARARKHQVQTMQILHQSDVWRVAEALWDYRVARADAAPGGIRLEPWKDLPIRFKDELYMEARVAIMALYEGKEAQSKG